jgi:ABC-type lipoprotein release transport system permease subunit
MAGSIVEARSGMIAGVIPARRAASINMGDALRIE